LTFIFKLFIFQRGLFLKTFTVDTLDNESYKSALTSFVKAMEFAKYYGNEQEIVEWIANSIKMFSRKKRFHCVGVRENQTSNTNNYIGFASLIPVQNSGWIPYVGVDPKFQGHGLGRQLMEEIFEIAKELGLLSIELCSSQKGIPFYKTLGFTENFPVCGYDIIEAKIQSQLELKIDSEIPEWLSEMDKEVVGINRTHLFQIHNYDELVIINEPYHGYGFLYKTRIGPIIADSQKLAEEIILKAITLGATSLVLVEDTPTKNKIQKNLTLNPQALMNNTKMTYGTPLQQNLAKLYGLRSVAYG
jgi:GNAT superfamily N-acetyltransferase